ncbi:hypothetical protein ABBQ38_001509 [Trebouxia sp. C0009 RCD-2024]
MPAMQFVQVSQCNRSRARKNLPGSSWAEPLQQQTPLKIGHSWKSLFGLPQPSAEQLSVLLQARGHEPSWVSFAPSGRGQEGGYLELGPDHTCGQLQITVQAGRRFVASGIVAVQELWQVGTAASPTHATPGHARYEWHGINIKAASDDNTDLHNSA